MKRKHFRISRHLDHLELEQRGRLFFAEMTHSNAIVARDPNLLLIKQIPPVVKVEFAEAFDPMREMLKRMALEI